MTQASALPRPKTSLRTLLRSGLVVAGVRGLDVGLSFLVSVLLANRFGASGQLDAFFLARRTTVGFADTIRKLVGQVVLPPVIAAMDRGQAPSVRLLPRRIAWFLAAIALATLAGILVPGRLIGVFAPGFRAVQHDLAATMMAIMMPLLPLAVGASLLAAILQARRRYMLSEGTNLVQRAVLVAVLAFLVPPLGILAGAWTMLASGVVGFVILLAGAWTLIRPRGAAQATPAPAPTTPGGGLAAALVLNLYFQATALMDFAFASTTTDGGVAALEYGSRLVSLVPGLVMSSLVTVLAPEMIRAVQQPDRALAAEGIQRFQRIAFFAQLPVSVGMMLGSHIMVRALFGHGAFDDRAVAMAAASTAGYAAAQIFLAPQSAITSAIFADPAKPALRDLAIIAAFGITVRLAMLAVAAPAWGAGGIAWAAAIATAVAAVMAQGVAARRFHHFSLRMQVADLARSALAAGVAAAAGWALLAVLPCPRYVPADLATLCALGATVLLTYAGAAMLLGVPELAAVREIIARKRRKRA